MTDNTFIVGGGVVAGEGEVVNYSGKQTVFAGNSLVITPSSASSTGTFTPTEAADTMAFTAVKTHLATMAPSEHIDIWNDLSPVDGLPDSGITIYPGFFGPWASTEADDTFTGAGPGHPPGLFASWDGQETPDVFDGAGSANYIAVWASPEAKDVFHGQVTVFHGGAWASTEAKDVFHGLMFTVGASGTFATTESPDHMNFNVFVKPLATWASTEIADKFSARAPGVVARIRRPMFVT